MKWYLAVLKNYANFNGRARRKEYWMYTLFCIIFCIVAAIIDNIIGTTFKVQIMGMTKDMHYGYIYILYSLAVFIPGLAVGIRRLHDVGKSGWPLVTVLIAIPFMVIAAINQLIMVALLFDLIVLGFGIWLLVLMVTDSQPGDNKYGPNPKSVSNPVQIQ